MTLSFNLAPGCGARRRGDGDPEDGGEHPHAGQPFSGTFQGTAQAFQASLKTAPYLILAALLAVYIILGMLYESYIHPLTILSTLPSAGVGALLMLMMFHFDLSVIALIGIILLIGIVKKNGIMMVDFAIQAEREQHLAPEAAIRQACLLRFRPIMMTTMAALLGALPLMLGPRHRLGAAPAARLYNGGRPAPQPGADPVHHSGDLPVPRPSGRCAGHASTRTAQGTANPQPAPSGECRENPARRG